MALTSTAKISDVVNVLNGVQGLNQKAELVSVVNDMTSYENEVKTDMINKINAVSTQNPINLPTNANWFDVAGAIPNIKTHDNIKQKKFKSGVTTVVGNKINVTGLDFIPSILIVYGFISPSYRRVVYQSDFNPKNDGGHYLGNFLDVVVPTGTTLPGNSSISSFAKSNWEVGYGYFRTVDANSSLVDGEWSYLAFE